ncbi:RE1-silencing transcription factor isoform X2 [Thalassophryne amazonica]|uniref:RE1-silencing transcription factor isoform X2 n=1 Tax=Thalassophryne amazonica TaxID=390379 RepID=UPI001471CD8E|nr:RE1-silencing transcription factor isoform X2 [Thalassophryne amazonica]
MAAQTVFSVGVMPVGVSLLDDMQNSGDMSRNTLAAPQLVMLANVAAVTAAEGGGCDVSVTDEKEMVELKTVGCSDLDSEDESAASYSQENHREVYIIEYPDCPAQHIQTVIIGSHMAEHDETGTAAEDLSCLSKPRPQTPQPVAKCKDEHGAAAPDGSKKKNKKPLFCRPCRFQAQNEQEFVEHLGTHAISKMTVVNKVEGRSQSKAKASAESQVSSGGEAVSSGETAAAGDGKGLIRCQRCGYNTNRYDHYIAHLKHHNAEGADHRVFKCTLCPYTTVSQYHWRKHLRNHFPSKLHTCSQCSYFSDRKSNYIQHIRTHTGVRPFQCTYCDYSSSQKTHLTRHMRTHSGERPFKCESCSYLAANQHEVTRHARQVHNGPKPLGCPYCTYKTADRSNFKKHVELHLNPRQFICPLCKYAASKKCNLQYHIKSRHSGCEVALDVSKVKLRNKKPGPGHTEKNPETMSGRFGNASNIDEGFEVDNGEDEGSCPINLSIRKSNRPSVNQPGQSDAADKTEKKGDVPSVKEKPPKTKEELENKVTKRQKKADKVTENKSSKDNPGETSARENKAKRRLKKPPAGKTTESMETVESAAMETSGKDQLRENSETREKRESKNQKTKKSGSKKSEKSASKEETPHRSQSQEKTPKIHVTKAKAAKRKAAKASPSELPSKVRRLKADNTDKPQSKSSLESTETTREPSAGPFRDCKTKGTETAYAPRKKTRNSSQETPSLQQSAAAAEETSSFGSDSSEQNPSAEFQEACGQMTDPTHSTNSGDAARDEAHPEKPASFQPQPALVDPSETMDVSPSCSSAEPTRRPTRNHQAPFAKPTSPPSLVLSSQRSKPGEAEDDEGIHSSHDGGSDISDSASVGSDDSGLNSATAPSGKTPNGPETPIDEIPTPTKLKSHTCIFCDRTFPQEGDYRRHLNRHLVHVYYMDNTANSQK